MLLELLAIYEALVTIGASSRAILTPHPIRLTLHLPQILLICHSLSLLLLLNFFEELSRVFVEIVLEVGLFLKIFVGVWQKLRILLNLPNFVQVVGQLLRRKISVYNLGRLIYDLLDDLILDHLLNVDGVVHVFEDSVFAGVVYSQNFEQLQPQVFQLVSVIFEQVEVVADGRQNLVKILLRLTAQLLRIVHSFDLFALLTTVCIRARLAIATVRIVLAIFTPVLLLCFTIGCVCGGCGRRCGGNVVLLDQLKLFGVIGQLILHRLHNGLNFALEEIFEVVSRDFWLHQRLHLNLPLLANDLHHRRVVGIVLVRALPIVQIY